MPNWPADDATHARAFAWTPWWLLAFVALWPLPGPAEGVLALGAMALLAQLLFAIARRRVLPLDRSAAWLATALFAVYWLPELLSAPDALDRGRALKEVAADLRYLPFLWGVAIAVHAARGRKIVFAGLALIVGAWTLDALMQALLGASPLFWSLDALKRGLGGEAFCSAAEVLAADRLGGVFGPCNLKLGLVLASLSPFLLSAASRRSGVLGWCVAALALGIAIVLGGARAAWLTYALVLVFSGWRALGARRLSAFAAASLLGIAALYLVSPQLQQRVARTTMALQADGSSVDGALSGRARIWQGAACMAREHPLNGVGVRGFRVAWPQCDPAPAQAPAWGGGEAYHAHQLVLELLSETGLSGLLLWLAGAGLVWRSWRRADPIARDRARPALLALAVTVFPLNTHLAFYSTFWGGLVLLLAGLYAGALYGRAGVYAGGVEGRS
ncbi:O-antigen ligase family protein [Pseudoxanthomonas daejeonensis]|uniref:O-antigen ligase family protein n=1 Tax=Pseudoxanthomonas daejeonensis TaxID=266062 RepID=UPI001F542F0F|nr:O-antigen ligase family protein [Pseudoxanthomonas daejeonensis]UNK58268.1 O-antigen ligase family protein [Pseudoxanthomonas daejeonensis]